MADSKLEKIKELRARTNSALVDVKKALEATDYNMDAAIAWLKENGIVKAAKKAGRVAAEGVVSAYGDRNNAVLVEVNSETDFVVKNDKFNKLVNEITPAIFNSRVNTLEEALKVKLADGQSVEEALTEATAVIGEKITLRRIMCINSGENQVLGIYVHANNQVASVVVVNGEKADVARNVAMHVSAMNPEFTLVSDMPAERMQEIKNGFEKPAGFDSKPLNIQEKIQEGWLNKQLSEFVLTHQPFVMDDGVSVEKYLANNSSSLVKSFRFEVGEGIEKVQSNFAEEVAAAANLK
ncbi:Elongation factor Ts [Mycoplasmopsis citelli]|uniref:Elongation factor Ts n=1 Tax=Mycoplasmopsis citelli TaxID=171281 RepID=A0A449B2W4_9BACT|nr:translation elongation factor Ts [Mycoplasmopsis citelli]VEU74895.1 Elongation factor Ts [Mycoplasmopsis citelli]